MIEAVGNEASLVAFLDPVQIVLSHIGGRDGHAIGADQSQLLLGRQPGAGLQVRQRVEEDTGLGRSDGQSFGFSIQRRLLGIEPRQLLGQGREAFAAKGVELDRLQLGGLALQPGGGDGPPCVNVGGDEGQ